MNNRKDFTKILAIDAETSGIAFGSVDPSVGFQSVAWGFVVADTEFNPIDRLYVEIKWNGESQWSERAEQVHGLSKSYLEKNGLSEEDAAVEIAEFLLNHFSPNDSIICLGHNVRNFDIPFLVSLLGKFDLTFKFAHRSIDTFSPGFILAGKRNSDEIFEHFGMPARHEHNALKDAEYALKVCRNIRKLWRAAYE